MKVGLINVDSDYQSDKLHPDLVYTNGIVYVDATLRARGHEVVIANFAHDRNANLNQVGDCDVIGVTSIPECYSFYKKIMPQLKEIGKPIIAGGALISSYGLSQRNVLMRAFPEIDYGVIGEAERTAPDLIDFLEGQRKELPRGIVYRRGEEIRTTDPRTHEDIVHNLDDLPEIDYTRFSGMAELTKGRMFNIQQLARGCFGSCSFCYLIEREEPIRSFSDERVKREIDKTLDLKPRAIHFADDTFTYNRKRAMMIGDLLADKVEGYVILTRVDRTDYELMKHLKKTGCISTRLGIESFDQGVLDRAGKRVKTQQIYDAIKCSQDAGVIPIGFFIIGLPGETRSSLERTIRGIEETRVLPQARLLIPLPGTRVYQEALRQGKIRDEIELLKSFSEHEYGGDTKLGDFVPINMSDGLSNQELLDARDKMNALRDKFEREQGVRAG